MKTTNNDGLLNRMGRYVAVLACTLVLAACGGGGGSPGGETTDPDVTVRVANISISSNTGDIPSSAAEGTEATITALVKNSQNGVIAGATVVWDASSGSVTPSTGITDENGIATTKLSTRNDPTNRAITVTASAGGVSALTIVNVVGTAIEINASNSVNAGSTSDITVTLKDSASNPLRNFPVAFSKLVPGNTLTANGATTPQNTNSSGQLALRYTATNGSEDTITVSAFGANASKRILINSTNFYVKAVNGASDITEANIDTCVEVLVHNDILGVGQTGTVNLSTSRGAVYSNAACTVPASSVTMSGGTATAYVQATNPGVATLSATFVDTGVSAQNVLEFVAPLTAGATIELQASPAVIGVNTATSTGQQSTIKAIVRDSHNNLVKNAPINFTADGTDNGYLTSPSSGVLTGSDGTATVNYVAGTSGAGLDGVTITGQIVGGSNALRTVKLTVGQQSLFISAGTGNTIIELDSTKYQKDYAVFVTDAAGNAVPGATVTASIKPRFYRKGELIWMGTSWGIPTPYTTCNDEDVDGDGRLDSGEDYNLNGRLDPGIPVTVSPPLATSASGTTTVSLTYTQDRALWTFVELTIRGSVTGSEAQYVASFWLPGLSSDYTSQTIDPPGKSSPYGTGSCEEPF